MLVYWDRYQKSPKQERSSQSENQLINQPNSDSSHFKEHQKDNSPHNDDYYFEPYSSNTSGSNSWTDDYKLNQGLIDFDVSSISFDSRGTDKEEDLDDSFDYVLTYQLESLFNSSSGHYRSALRFEEFLLRNFSKAIHYQPLFDCLLEIFYADPHQFFHSFFDQIIKHSLEIITSPISHLLLVKALAYFTIDQMTVFLSRVVKKHFNQIIKNPYGVLVLTEFVVNSISFDQSLLMSLLKIIIDKFSHIITDANSSKVIHTLLNINNPFISKLIIDAIGKNSLSIALSPNGVHITQTFILCPILRVLIVDKLLENIHVVLVHQNGHKVIELLLSLKNSAITVFVINSLLRNISALSNVNFSLALIEQGLTSLDTASVAYIRATLNDKALTQYLLQHKAGVRIVDSINKASSITSSLLK